jgi:hypothetical protein
MSGAGKSIIPPRGVTSREIFGHEDCQGFCGKVPKTIDSDTMESLMGQFDWVSLPARARSFPVEFAVETKEGVPSSN